MNRFCSPPCRICTSPGKVLCAASARAEAEERHEEETDRCHDEARAAMWARPSEPHTPNTYIDRWGNEQWWDDARKRQLR